jgi:hypothetical protein
MRRIREHFAAGEQCRDERLTIPDENERML